MNKVNTVIIALATTAITAFGFRTREGGTISGKVTPMDGASKTWAIQGPDTLNVPIADGTFTFQGIKNGTYTVTVEAKQPFRNVTIDNVLVEEGKITDLGNIKLEQ